jgi:2-octaprenyl-6-methoxyphenol hydroxylase
MSAFAPPCQIVIAGGGIAGLVTALALRDGLGRQAAIMVADPAFGAGAAISPEAQRAYTLSPSALDFLQRLGLWEAIASHAQPVREMAITDSRPHDVVRPTFLTFAPGPVESQEPVAHVVLAGALLDCIRQAATERGIDLVPHRLAEHTGLSARLDDGRLIRCQLVIAADGARSRLRESAGIGWVAWDYPQSGLVATIGHERDHGGRAVQHFLPGGPFARLPLVPGPDGGFRSSIVWSDDKQTIATVLALPKQDMSREIETRFGLELGEITLLDNPRAFGLGYGIARHFAANRLALVGDSAHIIHPLAGQGLNLGLKDAEALAKTIADAAHLGLDIGLLTVLAGYERARRSDTMMMGMAMDGLNRLFSNDALPVRLARDLGLGIVDRMPGLKRFFMSAAAGRNGQEKPFSRLRNG